MSGQALHDRALRLAPSAKALAVTSFVGMADRFPALMSVGPEHWDFVVTTAGVFVAISQLNHEDLPIEQAERIRRIVTNELSSLYPDGPKACEDCTSFVDRTYDGLMKQGHPHQFLFSDALGAWLVWNLFGHAPDSDEERQLVRILGVLIVHGFVNWWKEE